MSRSEDIQNYMESDSVWPALLNTPTRKRFNRALIEVLRRLPDDIFDTIEFSLGFVVQESDYRAINVPFKRVIPPHKQNYELKMDQVVIFSNAFDLSDTALVGLIAHEIAHSVEDLSDHFQNELRADERVKEWGFEKELAELSLSRKQ